MITFMKKMIFLSALIFAMASCGEREMENLENKEYGDYEFSVDNIIVDIENTRSVAEEEAAVYCYFPQAGKKQLFHVATNQPFTVSLPAGNVATGYFLSVDEDDSVLTNDIVNISCGNEHVYHGIWQGIPETASGNAIELTRLVRKFTVRQGSVLAGYSLRVQIKGAKYFNWKEGLPVKISQDDIFYDNQEIKEPVSGYFVCDNNHNKLFVNVQVYCETDNPEYGHKAGDIIQTNKTNFYYSPAENTHLSIVYNADLNFENPALTKTTGDVSFTIESLSTETNEF